MEITILYRISLQSHVFLQPEGVWFVWFLVSFFSFNIEVQIDTACISLYPFTSYEFSFRCMHVMVKYTIWQLKLEFCFDIFTTRTVCSVFSAHRCVQLFHCEFSTPSQYDQYFYEWTFIIKWNWYSAKSSGYLRKFIRMQKKKINSNIWTKKINAIHRKQFLYNLW